VPYVKTEVRIVYRRGW